MTDGWMYSFNYRAAPVSLVLHSKSLFFDVQIAKWVNESLDESCWFSDVPFDCGHWPPTKVFGEYEHSDVTKYENTHKYMYVNFKIHKI